jgi:hypothetical protein
MPTGQYALTDAQPLGAFSLADVDADQPTFKSMNEFDAGGRPVVQSSKTTGDLMVASIPGLGPILDSLSDHPHQYLLDKVEQWAKAGPHAVVEGLRDLTAGNYAKGTTQVLKGGVVTAAPMLAPELIVAAGAAPVATAAMLAKGGAGAWLSKQIAEKVGRDNGLTDDQIALLQTIGEIAGGIGGARLPTPTMPGRELVSAAARRVTQAVSPQTVETAVDLVTHPWRTVAGGAIRAGYGAVTRAAGRSAADVAAADAVTSEAASQVAPAASPPPPASHAAPTSAPATASAASAPPRRLPGESTQAYMDRVMTETGLPPTAQWGDYLAHLRQSGSPPAAPPPAASTPSAPTASAPVQSAPAPVQPAPVPAPPAPVSAAPAAPPALVTPQVAQSALIQAATRARIPVTKGELDAMVPHVQAGHAPEEVLDTLVKLREAPAAGATAPTGRPEQVDIEGQIPDSKSRRGVPSATPGLTVADVEGIGLNPNLRIKKLTSALIARVMQNRRARQGLYITDAALKKSTEAMAASER